MIDFLRTIQRIKSFENISTDLQLSELFGLSPQDFNKRKKRGTLLPLIVSWAINRKVDLNWLIKGERAEFGNGSSVRENDCGYLKITEDIGSEKTKYSFEFKDKSRAITAHKHLSDIERVDKEAFAEVVGYIKGVANGLKNKTVEQYNGNDRRSGGDRRKPDL